jgi:hypothetical protein
MAMLYKSKGKNSTLRFNVKTVNLAKPTDEFKHHGLRHTPALVESEEAFDTMEDILVRVDCGCSEINVLQEFLDSRHPQPSMQYFDPDADEACEDLFSKFAWFIKEVNTLNAYECPKLSWFAGEQRPAFIDERTAKDRRTPEEC